MAHHTFAGRQERIAETYSICTLWVKENPWLRQVASQSDKEYRQNQPNGHGDAKTQGQFLLVMAGRQSGEKKCHRTFRGPNGHEKEKVAGV